MITQPDCFTNLIIKPNLVTGLTRKGYCLEQALDSSGLATLPAIIMQQVHETTSKQIQDDSLKIVPETDAIYTTKQDIVLAVKMADCLPILVYHPLPLIAVIHAGRKGTELGITQLTITKLQEQFKLKDGFSFWLGPCICEACYQIDQDLDLHYDLRQKNVTQILATKAAKLNDIEIAPYCTCCNNDLFYSYRMGENVLRNFAFAVLK